MFGGGVVRCYFGIYFLNYIGDDPGTVLFGVGGPAYTKLDGTDVEHFRWLEFVGPVVCHYDALESGG